MLDPERPGVEGARAVAQIRELVERVHDPHVRALLLAFLDDPVVAERLPVAPAAKGIHHAHRGGLAEHILSVLRLGNRVADHYPVLDRDLIVAGALLHDIGKVVELAWDGGNTRYTDEGRLVGHLVLTAQAIRQKAAAIEGFPPLLEAHLTHLVLSHHGQLEYGSPKVPMTLEALVVHSIDTLDSRIASWLDLMARDPGATWTEHTKLYDRHLWKGPLPTARGRAPVESRGRRNEKRKRPRPGPAPGPASPGAHPASPKLSFKPLEMLTSEPSAPATNEPAAVATESAPTPTDDPHSTEG